MANNYIDGQQIFFGTCLGSDDPLMLGRVRVLPETMNEASLANSNSKFENTKAKIIFPIFSANVFPRHTRLPPKNGP